ncbi:MAG: autotransporter outer membrane beta-barrel domain-containing protein, partial [Planctomycetota bacterium]
MANVVWSSAGSTDGNVAGNWNPARVPTTGDTAYFDATSAINCTFSGNISCDGLNATAAYSGDIDFGDSKTHTWGASNFTLAHTGATDLGTGTTHNAASCDWTVVAATGSWTRGTSTVSFTGTCAINTGTTNNFFNLIVASGTATVSTNDTRVGGACTINGVLSVNTGKRLQFLTIGTILIGDGGRLTGTGTGYVWLYGLGGGNGVTSFHANGTWDIPEVRLIRTSANLVLVPGNYQSTMRIINDSAANFTLALIAAGAYQFSSLELETTSTGSQTLDNTNGPTSITVGDLTIDENAGGAIVIDDSGQSVDWTITGDVIDQRTGDTFTWTKGTGDITLSGSADQDIDFMGQVIEDIIINKSAGALTFSGAFTTDSFTGTSTGTGDLDPNGQTITITGNCSWAAAFDFNSAADTMNGCTWIVGGNFTANGQTLNATAIWTLS